MDDENGKYYEVGETFTTSTGMEVICKEVNDDGDCSECKIFGRRECAGTNCISVNRKDEKNVYFELKNKEENMASKKVKELRDFEEKTMIAQLNKYNKEIVVKERTATEKAITKIVPKSKEEMEKLKK